MTSQRRGSTRSLLLLAILLLPHSALAHGGRNIGPVMETDPDEHVPGDPVIENAWLRPGRIPVTFDSWRFSWHAVENGILEETRSRRRAASPASAAALPARTVEDRILPALRFFAASGALDRDITSEAILGLARSGAVGALPELRTWAWNRDEESRRSSSDEECSTLALGLLPDPDARSLPLLRRIAADREIRVRTRAFATFALAFRGVETGTAENLESLRAALDSSHGDLPAAAAFALGRLGGADVAALLLQRLSDPASDGRTTAPGFAVATDLLRAHEAAALGRAAAGTGPSVEEPARVVLLAETRTRRRLPVIGAVVGLGHLGSGAGERTAAACVETLGDLLRSRTTESHARRRAAMALAAVGARGPSGARRAARDALRAALEDRLPDSSTACLALGIALRDATVREREVASERIRLLIARESAPEDPERRKGIPNFLERAGGGVLALGLLRDLRSRPGIESILADPGESTDLRGYAAEALGLLGDGASLPLLRRLAADRNQRPMRRELAIALGLLGDGESVDALLGILTDVKASTFVMGGASQALGWLADPSTVEPLLAVARDDSFPNLTRAYAVQVLGRMAAGTRPDPFAPLTEDGLYRASFDAVNELWKIL